MTDFLVTLTAAKEYLKVSNTNSDNVITRMISGITKAIERYCKRVFKKTSYSEFFSGKGGDVDEQHTILFVRNPPISSITALFDDIDRVYGTSTQIATTDFVSFEEEGIVEVEGIQFRKGLKNIKLNYEGGFATSDFATVGELADVIHATLIYLGQEWKRFDRSLHGLDSVDRADVTESYSINEMPTSVKELIDPFVLLNL